MSILGKVDSMQERQPRILIADDDVDTRYILSGFLVHRGYETITAPNGEEALSLAARLPLDLALLDVVMPGPSGVELASRLKDLQPQIEVILITAYGSLEQAVEAMHQGVFYYLAKPLELKRVLAAVEEARAKQQALVEEPLEMSEVLRGLSRQEREVLALLAEGKTDSEIAEALCISIHTASTHVRDILCRMGVSRQVLAAGRWPQVLQAKDLTLNLDARRAWLGDEEIPLTKLEFDLLAYLVRNSDRVVSYDELLTEVWGYSPDIGDPAQVRMAICRLRRKLKEKSCRRLIVTVRGVGCQVDG